MLYQHIKTQREADADKARTASFIYGFKNDQSYELIDEEILKIHQVKSEKIKVEVYTNQEKSLSLHKDTD